MLCVGDRLRMNTVVSTASPHNQFGTPMAFIKLLAMPSTIWLHFSTMPFYWGVYGTLR
jgi:hypothetical protein